jgi:hypothetical protein
MSRNRLALETLEDRLTPTSAQFVTSLYANLLNRTASQAEIAGWVSLLDSGTLPTTVATAFVQSTEYLDLTTRNDYLSLLNRPPSAEDTLYWRTQRQNGLTDHQEQVQFLASDEYFALHGGSTQGWLTGAYHDILNRTPDPTGLAAFSNLAIDTQSVRQQVASLIVFSPEASNLDVNQAYQQLLGRLPDASGLTYWAGQLTGGLPLSTLLASVVSGSEFASELFNTGAQSTTGSTTSNILALTIPALDVNLLGLEVKTEGPITITVTATSGNGKLLGNLLTDVSHLLNLPSVNAALNNVLSNVITLVNSASLSVAGVDTTSGPLSSAEAAVTTPVLTLHVAPVHLDLLGAVVDTTPIDLSIVAHSGTGLVLGNLVTDLANLFNPPLPDKLTIDTINTALENLLSEVNAQIPNIGSSPTTSPTLPTNGEQIVSLTLAPINLNLLGLMLQTSQIQVNADAITGNGELLGNVLTTLLNTLGATPQNLTTLSNDLNAVLGKAIGVLNASSLVLPTNALASLSQALQTLAVPNLTNATGAASTPILNLNIASSDGTTPPVNVNLLGLQVTTSNIQAQLLAQTGDGQILGNLLYNVANLLNPGGSLNLLGVLGLLGL